jgi:hypothetical protein
MNHQQFFSSDGVARADFEKLVSNAIQGANTGDELAAVALLLQGAGLVDQYGDILRRRIMDRVKHVNSTSQVSDAVRQSRGIGEAMLRLQ